MLIAERYLKDHRQNINKTARSLKRLHMQAEEKRKRTTLEEKEGQERERILQEAENRGAEARWKVHHNRRAVMATTRHTPELEDTKKWEAPMTQMGEDNTDQWCVIGNG